MKTFFFLALDVSFGSHRVFCGYFSALFVVNLDSHVIQGRIRCFLPVSQY